MFKTLFTAITAFTLALLLAPAVAGQDKAAEAVEESAPAEVVATKDATDGEISVMDLPVDFSTPGDVEKSIEKVREQAGEKEARKLENALGYILAYDLSVSRDKEKMYKKLNGRTPNAIIAKMKR